MDHSDDVQLNCARAIGVDGTAFVIDRHNQKVGPRSLSFQEAVTSGEPYVVQVQEEVLALDGDHEGALHDVTNFLSRASELGIDSPAVVVASGQPGRAHVFLRIANVFVRARARDAAKELGFDVRRDIRPPLAPHRLGLAPRLISPSSAEEAIAALKPSSERKGRVLNYYETEALIESGAFDGTRRNSRSSRLDPPTEPAFRNLPLGSPTLATVLETGSAGGADSSRSAALHVAVLAAYRQAWSRQEVLQAAQGAPRLGDRLLEEDDPELYVDLSWEKADADGEARERRAVRLDIRFLREAVDATAWAGRDGPATRRVFHALLNAAHFAPTLEPVVSMRRLAGLAGVHESTVCRAASRLEGDWLTVGRVDAYGGTSHWSLRRVDAAPAHEGPLQQGGTHLPSLLAHDAFRHRALGSTAWETLHLLSQDPGGLTARGLATLVSCAPETARKRLRKLGDHGLAERAESGRWQARPDLAERLELIADGAGTAGSGAHDRARHRAESARVGTLPPSSKAKCPALVDSDAAELPERDAPTGRRASARTTRPQGSSRCSIESRALPRLPPSRCLRRRRTPLKTSRCVRLRSSCPYLSIPGEATLGGGAMT